MELRAVPAATRGQKPYPRRPPAITKTDSKPHTEHQNRNTPERYKHLKSLALSPCTPWPSCFGGAYQVSGTPDNSLWEWTDSPSNGFSGAVNATVKSWVGMVHSAADSFDSGYLDYPADGNTSEWQNDDWKNAVGHGFYRVVGTRQSDGSRSVHLQLTSYRD